MKTIKINVKMNGVMVLENFSLQVFENDEIDFRAKNVIELVKKSIISGENKKVSANESMVNASNFTYEIIKPMVIKYKRKNVNQTDVLAFIGIVFGILGIILTLVYILNS